MNPRTLSGTVTRYLLSGPREDEKAVLEIQNSTLIAAYVDGEEIDINDISQEDYEHAISELVARI